ncbi:LysR family transcriptional regulator [Pandoraea anapnoica]|uniref:LysR family transcriptional regulator n=1 Tax=Pandoraea anapnoica TaxID=2508301 RepID=A0A5E5AJM1_9BURK|nr:MULTISPECIES: LysR family transcriptional regulator [Pandoraea]VVE42719.1 LysR family transcriptional regulator [Pandoraea iniqua]VVE73207.1 LysR family transcriptional regulator [Pandoraea anapnoica]
MEYRHLRAFIAVFEERNITAAAHRMHLTQPAISNCIKQLEQTLGVSLFSREARGVGVTTDGRSLYPQAKRMVADIERLRIRFHSGRAATVLEMGVGSDVSGGMLSSFVQRVERHLLSVSLHVREGCEGEIRLESEERRCEGELFTSLWVEPYVLAYALGLDFGGSGESFIRSRWVTCPSHPTHQQLLPFYGEAGENAVAQATSLRRTLDLVAAGAGVAIVPRSLVMERRGVGAKLIPSMAISRRVGLCIGAQALRNPHISRLYETVVE